jgi:hypothetical protein
VAGWPGVKPWGPGGKGSAAGPTRNPARTGRPGSATCPDSTTVTVTVTGPMIRPGGASPGRRRRESRSDEALRQAPAPPPRCRVPVPHRSAAATHGAPADPVTPPRAQGPGRQPLRPGPPDPAGCPAPAGAGPPPRPAALRAAASVPAPRRPGLSGAATSDRAGCKPSQSRARSPSPQDDSELGPDLYF